MSLPKWVALFIASCELACHWGIPSWVAEQIVRGVLQGGECFVRGRGPDGILRDISREIVATLSPSVLASAVFSDVEIEWNGLVQQGRKLVPPEWEQFVQAAEARSADDAEPIPTAVAETAHTTDAKPTSVDRSKHGPEPGKLRRYDAGDIELFPELEQLMRAGHSRTAAARTLAEAGKIAGPGTLASKAKRLAKLHKLHQSKSGESGN
jgi:hypothetical protein